MVSDAKSLMDSMRRSAAQVAGLWPKWKRDMCSSNEGMGEWVDEDHSIDIDLTIQVIDEEIERLRARRREIEALRHVVTIEPRK